MSLRSLAGRRLRGEYEVDEWGADPDLVDMLAPVAGAFVRVRVEGARHIPASGPAVLVANRRVGLVEPFILLRGVREATGRRARFLGIPDVAPVGPLLRRFGGTVSRPDELAGLLRAGHLAALPLGPAYRKPLRAGALAPEMLAPVLAAERGPVSGSGNGPGYGHGPVLSPVRDVPVPTPGPGPGPGPGPAADAPALAPSEPGLSSVRAVRAVRDPGPSSVPNAGVLSADAPVPGDPQPPSEPGLSSVRPANVQATHVPVIPVAVVGGELTGRWDVLIGEPVARPTARGPLALAELADAARSGVQALLDEAFPPRWPFS